MAILVMKFGGASVGTTTALTQVLSIVLQERERWDHLFWSFRRWMVSPMRSSRPLNWPNSATGAATGALLLPCAPAILPW